MISTAEFVMLGSKHDANYLYRIELNRVENEIAAKGDGYAFDPSAYGTVTAVTVGAEEGSDLDEEFLKTEEHCVVRLINGRYYRIDYRQDLSDERREIFLRVNICFGAVALTLAFILIFLYFSVIRNFVRLSDYPEELAKGHMVPPLPQSGAGFFGRFLWGLDVLREKLEDEKKKNYELQKERNVFLLSLSHDIKTPLSAIKLYAASLKKKLYKDEDKTVEIAGKIDHNANEIEAYVSKIISASGDDFLNFSVNPGEFYLKDVIEYIRNYYAEKLSDVGTELCIGEYSDVLLSGDRERFIEVLQNIFENAVKYGDGRRISVEFREEEDCRLITVSNTGCTLSEDETEHIFESFFRGSNAGNKSGSGLGLFICKKLMNLMHGEIFAERDGDLMKITLVCPRR
ncbi:MAG: HAMP domain-containing histidine kinase [Lachnospiraceae bacterium]|nr:HAMP domain-containing histidine kinase [Lachnospiraceae bacterium]